MTNRYHIIVDVEADGPIPGPYSMVSFGAIVLEPTLSKTFYGQCKPISEKWIPEALAISKHSREETLRFPEPKETMQLFANWIISVCGDTGPVFWADNNGFDWQYINWYFHTFYGSNPFGFSSQNINSLYKGLTKVYSGSFKHLRKTNHTHHPVDDAKGNAEAMLELNKMYNLNLI